MNINKTFAVEDQLFMEGATNYRSWIFSLIAPWLKGSILEIGAGIGNITGYILNDSKNVNSLTCLDIDPQCCEHLKYRISMEPQRIKVAVINNDFMTMENDQKFDCVLSLNFLEHIKDDTSCISRMEDMIVYSGTLLCFLPAFPILYGSVDKNIGHYRRYSKKDLTKKIHMCGFSIIKMRYYNTIGFFGWLFNNRILQIQAQNPIQIALFDKYILPFQRRLESIVEFPFGQSIFCVMKKK